MKKNISAKKVFKIFGIVFGAVLAFVGAVVGVMAAMGKFKKPVVYPTELVFLDNDSVVFAKETYDATLVPADELFDIYSFTLQGVNPGEEHDVNKKNCYIWFHENIGVDLITLCDENGIPLQKDEKNRYLVQCNEPTYYMINEISKDADSDGKVQIWARTENNKVEVDEPLTLWIDRIVDGIFVEKDGFDSEIKKYHPNVQEITIGVDLGFDFKYVIGDGNGKVEAEDALSLKPIGKENAKEIELYYNVEGRDYGTDYVRVTEEEINKSGSPLNSILTCEDGVFKFKSSVAEKHQFYIATFKTYEYKQNYLASIAGLTIDNPNYHRLTSWFVDSDEQKVQYMTMTELNIVVEPIEVSEVGFGGTNVVLNLYSAKDYITLDGSSNIDGAKDNNLELYMKKGEDVNSIYDYSRFDEVRLNAFKNLENLFDNKIPRFVGQTTENNEDVIEYTDNDSLTGLDICGSGIYLTDKIEIISYLFKIGNEDVKYYCSNGVAVVDRTGTATIKILKAGSYLNFFTEKDGKFNYIDIDCDVLEMGSSQNKTWQVITKEIPDLTNGTLDVDDDFKLKLGILVVNNHSKFYKDKFFKTIDATIDDVDLKYEVLERTVDLDITYLDATKVDYPEKEFEKLIGVTDGSYNACVFVTDKKADGNYIVSTIPAIEFNIDNKPYVLVGYEENENFINSVQILDKVSSTNKSCEVYMLQLKNEHNKDVNHTIKYLKEHIDEVPKFVNSLYINDSITINAKYIINKDLLSFKYDNNPIDLQDNYSVYEKAGEHTIVVNSLNKEMLTKVVEFYGLNDENKDDFFSVNYEASIKITEYDFAEDQDDEDVIVLKYQALEDLNDNNTVVKITLDGLGNTIEFPGILVLSGSPKDIVLNTGDKTITLSNSEDDALASQEYLQIKVKYDHNKEVYFYEYKLNGTYVIATDNDYKVKIFNNGISSPTQDNPKPIGFQDAVDKGQSLTVSYDSADKKVFNTDNLGTQTNLVQKADKTVLIVTIGETTKYLRIETIVEISDSEFQISRQDEKTSFDKNITDLNLNDIIDGEKLVPLKFNNQEIELTKNNLVYVDNVKCVYYNDGNVVVDPNEENSGWTLIDRNENTILTIQDTGTGWEFEKNNQSLTLMIIFDVVTVAGTKTINFTFSSDVEIAVNDVWTNNRVFYADTTVVFESKNEVSTGEYESNECAVFKTAETVSFKVSTISNNPEKVYAEIYEVNNNKVLFEVDKKFIGKISIQILLDETPIHTFTDFEVRPNVIDNIVQEEKTITTEKGEQKIKVDKTFESGTSYSILDTGDATNPGVYNLQQYDDSITYGESADKLYYSVVYYTDDTYQTQTTDMTKYFKINTETRNNCETLSNVSDLEISSEEYVGDPDVYWEEDTSSENYNKFVISEMAELEVQKIRKINLVYKLNSDDEFIVSTREITIKNKHKVDNVNPNADLVVKALKIYNVSEFPIVAGFNLNRILADGLDFEVKDGKITLRTAIDKVLQDVDATLIFKNGEVELTYQTILTIEPYTPEENGTNEKAHSGLEFDLFGWLYDASDWNADENVEKLVVNAILDENGKEITSEIIKGTFAPSGYFEGETGAKCEVEFNEIVGNSKTVKVQFEITYANNGLSYLYTKVLEILNRQEINVCYPEQDTFIENGTFKFMSGFEQDGAELSKKEISNEGIYEFSRELNLNYESVMLFTDGSQIVEFDYDDVKKISRSIVENKQETGDSEKDSTNVKITLIGYQNNPGMAEYVTRVNTKYDTNAISLPYAIQGMSGVLVFKLETASGNAKYYFIYVYCVGTSSAMNEENNLKVVAYSSNSLSLNEYSNENVAQIKIEAGTTYGDIVKSLASETDLYSEVDGNQSYLGIFGRSYKNTTTKVYLYNATYTGEVDGNAFDFERYFEYKYVDKATWEQDCKNGKVYDESYTLVEADATYDSTETYYYKKSIKNLDVTNQEVTIDKKINTITLGLLYQSGVESYVYGTITLYVQADAEVVLDNDLKSEYNVSYDVPNGEFNAEIKADETLIKSPFGDSWKATIVSVDGEAYLEYFKTQDETAKAGKKYYSFDGSSYTEVSIEEGKSVKDHFERSIYLVDETEESQINISKRVAKETVIRVKYSLDEKTFVFVNYTYEATVLPTATEAMVVGQFDKAKGFITSVDLKSEDVFKDDITFKEYFFGTYSGNYEVENLGVNAEWNKKDHKIEFTQTTRQLTINATFKYLDFNDDNNTRTFTFILKAGIEFEEDNNSSISGLSTSRRALTESTDSHSTNVGSQLNIEYKKVEIDSSIGESYYKYIVRGLTIYTHAESCLELTFDELAYVMNASNKKVVIYTNKSEGNVDFAHSAMEVPVTMNITIKHSSSYEDYIAGNAEEYSKRNFYLTVIPTYSMLEANYLVDDADHENVKGESTVEDLHTTLLNSRRVQLLGTTINTTTGKYEPITENVNLSEMGFATEGNPNYIEFSTGANATIRTFAAAKPDDPDTKGIIFNRVTTNTLCEVYLNNNAGMSGNSVWYTYQIMAGSEVDGLNYSSTNGIHIETSGSQNEYISFTMKDVYADKDYVSDLFIIGSMLDENNRSIFEVSNAELTRETKSTIVDGKSEGNTIVNKKGQTQGIGDLKENDYVNAIQYKFIKNKYEFYLTFDIDQNTIELIVIREAGAEVDVEDEIVLTFNIAGVNGGVDTIAKDLKIVLNNYQVSGMFEAATDMSIYSGYTIDLIEKMDGVDKSNVSYVLKEGSYMVDGETRYITSEDVDNELFRFADNKLETRAVGSDVQATVVFSVKSSAGYIFKEITYNFKVKQNMQFVVNGEGLKENEGNSTPETNFVLTCGEGATTGSEFPIESKLISKEEFNSNDDYKVNSNYYNVLVVDLYRLHIQNNDNATDDEKIMSRNLFTVELYSNIENGVLAIEKAGNDYKIVFYKDYTGEIELKLSLKTDNGTYYVIWTVYVYGIKDLNYTSSNPEYSVLQNNALPFNSSEQVALISNAKGTGVGILMTNSPYFASNVEMTVNYEYKIITYNNETRAMSNQALFNDVLDSEYFQGEDEKEDKINSNSYKITLPSVPSTNDDSQTYLVTYKIYVEYLGLKYDEDESKNEVKVFYVTYMVINRQQIELRNADINVDDDLDTSTASDKYYLDMFYFKETATSSDDTTYTFEFINGTLQLTVAGTSYVYDGTDFKNPSGTDKYSYDVNNKKLTYTDAESRQTSITFEENEITITPNNEKSMFSSDFTNIFEYAKFIETYLNKTKDEDENTKDTYIEIGDKAFTLVHIAGGRYGIDLGEKFKDDPFNNELRAEFKLVENGVPTYTIPAYSELNINGFRLTTNNKITPKTNGGAGYKLSVMFLEKYFTRNYIKATTFDSTKIYYTTTDGKTYTTVDSPVEANLTSYYELSEVTLSTPIIGVGTPTDGGEATGWTNKGTADYDSDSQTYATITIPGGGTDVVYNVKKVTYTSKESTLSIYSLKQEFYYIADKDNVIVPNYGAVGIESTFFKKTYIPDVADQVIDLTKAFKVWTMTDGEMKDNGTIDSVNASQLQFVGSQEGVELPSGGSSITIQSKELIDYKKMYPNKKNYPTVKATITVNSMNFLCEIVFALPDYVTLDGVEANKYQFNPEAPSDVEVNLIEEKLCIPNSSNGFVELENSNLNRVKFIDEVSSGSFASYTNGVLKIAKDKLKTYFEDETKVNLYLTFRLTTIDDKTLDFQVVVQKTS